MGPGPAAAPGPTAPPAPAASAASRLARVRARLDLPTVRRAAGLLEGRHRSVFTGRGQDFDDQVEYRPGDDVTDIDWKSSARAGTPIIRRFVRESNLAVVLAVDTGRTMAATAAGGEPKPEVALAVADVVAYLARARGDLVGLVAGDAGRLVQLPARHGTAHLETLLRTLERALALPAPPSDLGRVLDRVLTWSTRRCLVVVITDDARPEPAHEDALRRLRARHEVMVVAVADALPTAPGIGPTADVDGPVLPAYLRADPDLHAEARAAAADRTARVRAMLRRRGVEQVSVAGTDDVVDALVDLLRRQRRARR
ncbi:DUF58 domain-containing protein [Georgenia sp. TF02-10]|uniref:DUF58 domain-containing protein n=1 Tax=Georgenia sp. TF02-10 TaxID=2917725 RepID=UPI001FA817B3|nr:DUF58 domain-containing protein [Georgenia sp. TF02-10]UNX54694.1 DUF58 domain-containing protein [Georgenia sp. TF02-10]